jgi:uncharacterized membrane protein YgcG
MTGSGRRFDPAELRTSGAPGSAQPTDSELARALGIARDLEALAATEGIAPTDGFEDRVMAAIAAEPAPRLVVRSSSRRGGPLAAFAVAFRDALGVATGGGRPLAVRAQALTFVLLVVLGIGALTVVGAATVGGLLQGRPSPVPSVKPAPTVAPTPSPPASPAPSPSAETPEPTETPEPAETPEARQTARPGGTDDHGGATAAPGGTDDHGGNSGPGSSDDHGGNSGPGGGGSGGGRGSDGGSGGSGGSGRD